MPIIPETKSSGPSGPGISVHNDLSGLQGGKLGEYYHNTKEMFDWIVEQMNPKPPEVPDHYDGGYAGTTDYTQNLDGGPAPDQDRGVCDAGGA